MNDAELLRALADRNDLARQCADIRDERDALAAEVVLLRPLATAGRELVCAWEEDDADELSLTMARQALTDAAHAWWDR